MAALSRLRREACQVLSGLFLKLCPGPFQVFLISFARAPRLVRKGQ